MEDFYETTIQNNIEEDPNSCYNRGVYFQMVEKKYDDMKLCYETEIMENKNVRAMFNLGFYYHHIEKDYVKMKKYYSMAIEQGFCNAMINMGFYFYLTKNDEDMFKYYLLKAIHEYNDSVAMIELGRYYTKKGKFDRAYFYLSLAKEKGDPDANMYLEDLTFFVQEILKSRNRVFMIIRIVFICLGCMFLASVIIFILSFIL